MAVPRNKNKHRVSIKNISNTIRYDRRDRETEKQRDREAERQKDRLTKRQRDREMKSSSRRQIWTN